MPSNYQYDYVQGNGHTTCSSCMVKDSHTRILRIPGILNLCRECVEELNWGLKQIVNYPHGGGWVMDRADIEFWRDKNYSANGDAKVDLAVELFEAAKQDMDEVRGLMAKKQIIIKALRRFMAGFEKLEKAMSQLK